MARPYRRVYNEFPLTAKVCLCCHVMKPLASFYIAKSESQGARAKGRGWKPRPIPYCKTCHIKRTTDRMLIRNYGITHEMYELLFREQKGACAICGSMSPGKPEGRFPVDHDHLTGKVRGLLCHLCNKGIGGLRHTPKLLRKAAKYLEKPPATAHLYPAPDVEQAQPQIDFLNELEQR